MGSNQPPSQTPPPPSNSSTDSKPEKIDFNEPCRIKSVSFEGAHKTRPRLLAKIVADIFQATTVLDFLHKSVQVKENLSNLGAFSDVDIQVKPIDDEYDVTFVVRERGRINASATTAVDNHSSHLNLQLTLPNLNGVGDYLQLSSKFNKRIYSGEFRYSLPLAPWRSLWSYNYSLSCSKYQLDSMPSGYDQEDKSIINQIDFHSRFNLHHSISFENIWRYIKSSSVRIPIEIREQSGHSVKSSIKYTTTWDNRIGGNFPQAGILARLTNECTTNLVNHGARFTRHEANLQLNALILPKYDVICQLNILAGTLLKSNRINICDKFFAGGPLTIRGFRLNGLAPTRGGFPLGAASFLSAGMHIYSILPYTTLNSTINDYIRPHIFFNSGTIGDIHDLSSISRENIKNEARRFVDSLRYSVGFGVVMYFLNLRLEINYCLPLVFREQDLSVKGVQWGFGLTYT